MKHCSAAAAKSARSRRRSAGAERESNVNQARNGGRAADRFQRHELFSRPLLSDFCSDSFHCFPLSDQLAFERMRQTHPFAVELGGTKRTFPSQTSDPDEAMRADAMNVTESIHSDHRSARSASSRDCRRRNGKNFVNFDNRNGFVTSPLAHTESASITSASAPDPPPNRESTLWRAADGASKANRRSAETRDVSSNFWRQRFARSAAVFPLTQKLLHFRQFSCSAGLLLLLLYSSSPPIQPTISRAPLMNIFAIRFLGEISSYQRHASNFSSFERIFSHFDVFFHPSARAAHRQRFKQSPATFDSSCLCAEIIYHHECIHRSHFSPRTGSEWKSVERIRVTFLGFCFSPLTVRRLLHSFSSGFRKQI